MKVHRPLDDIFRGKGVLQVLRLFCRHPGSHLTAPEIARRGRLSLSQAQSALAALEGHGMVDRTVVGRSHAWTFRSGNALFAPLQALFEEEQRLESQLMSELEQGLRTARVRRALLFGSVGRSEEQGWSDVDVLVELNTDQDREHVWRSLVPLGTRIRERFGLNLSPIVVTPAEARKSLGPNFLTQLNRDAKIIREAA